MHCTRISTKKFSTHTTLNPLFKRVRSVPLAHFTQAITSSSQLIRREALDSQGRLPMCVCACLLEILCHCDWSPQQAVILYLNPRGTVKEETKIQTGYFRSTFGQSYHCTEDAQSATALVRTVTHYMESACPYVFPQVKPRTFPDVKS